MFIIVLPFYSFLFGDLFRNETVANEENRERIFIFILLLRVKIRTVSKFGQN